MDVLNGLGVREVLAGLWAAGQLVVYLLPSYAAWVGRRRYRVVRETRWLRLAARAGRWALWIGVPYLALGGWPMRSGALPASAMGWIGSAWSVRMWAEALGHGLLIGLAILLGVGLTRFYVGRAHAARGRPAPVRPEPSRPWWERLVEVAVLDVHWAFYWAAMAVVSGDRYAGIWLGLGLIYLELILHPFSRCDLASPELSRGFSEQTALALGVGLVFWQTGSLWVCLAVHWLLEMVLSQSAPLPGNAVLAAE